LYKIGLENSDLIKPQIKEIIEKKNQECINVLKKFIQVYGGESKYTILNRRSEDKIMGEDSIDLLPIKQHWHTDIAKKVYNEATVEFSDPAFASNYLRTRALEDKMDVVDRLTELIESRLSPALENLSVNLNTHIAVEKKIEKGISNFNKVVNKLNNRLSQRKLNEYL